MLLNDPHSWRLHRTWFWPLLVLSLGLAGWFVFDWITEGTLPGGSSGPGLTAGLLAGLWMFYLFAYAFRKRWPLRIWFRFAPTSKRLREHIWLGLFTLPLVLLHARLFTSWGWLTGSLLVSYFAVFLSGIWGLWRQQELPRQMLQEVPDETIRSQIPVLTEQLRQEAELLVLATCGPPPEQAGGHELPAALKSNLDTLRAARGRKGAGLLALVPPVPIADTEPLRQYFHDAIDPYLRSRASGSLLGGARAPRDSEFRDLRARVSPEAHGIVDALHALCKRRQHLDAQEVLHHRLHDWIGFHLVLSVLLVALLIWHVCTAPLYW